MKVIILLSALLMALVEPGRGESPSEELTPEKIGAAQHYWLLNRACCFGDEMSVKMLLAAGADVNGTEDYKAFIAKGYGLEPSWPINLAAIGGHVEVVKLLLEHGAKVDHPEGDGYTALVFATSNGHADVVQLLLEAGADPQIKSWEGSPIEIARKKKLDRILSLLQTARKKSEQAGTDLPTTKPADKTAVKEQPSPPTPKGGPR